MGLVLWRWWWVVTGSAKVRTVSRLLVESFGMNELIRTLGTGMPETLQMARYLRH
jgi:hypothetical protein